MDSYISFKQFLAITLVILLLNNLSLWFLFNNRLSNELNSNNTSSVEISKTNAVQLNNNGIALNEPKDYIHSLKKSNQRDIEDQVITDAVSNYMKSEEFIKEFELLQKNSYKKLQTQYESYQFMTGPELLNAYLNETSTTNKNVIMSYLSQKSLSAVDSYELKEILANSEIDSHSKSTIIHELLEREDYDALNLAKEFLSNNFDRSKAIASFKTLQKLFEVDRDFVVELVSSLSLEELSDSSILLVIGQDSSAIKKVFQNQLDNILISDDPNVFENLTYYSVPMALSADQKTKIKDLMQSKRSGHRGFAISMVHSIEDVKFLKSVFEDLKLYSDRQSFMYGLAKNTESKEHKELFNELAENSDDPSIRQFINIRTN